MRIKTDRFAQEIDAVGEQSIAAPLQQIHSEEVAAARHTVAAIIGHRSTPL
jgi:hypothetical protein